MAYVTLNEAFAWPGNTKLMSGAVPVLGNIDTLDGTNALGNDSTALVICAPQDMTISHVFPRFHVTTSTPTCTVRIETVDPATGFPTGTLWAANTNGTSGTLTTVMNTIALTAPATILKGQIFAVVFGWINGTMTISTAAVTSTNAFSMPYKVTNVTGVWVRTAHNGVAVVLGSSATAMYCIPGFYPVTTTIGANAFNNTSSARRGARFRPPFDCYVSGFRYLPGTAVGDFTAAILDASNAELNSSSTLFEGDVTSTFAQGCHNLYFDNEVGPLLKGADYFLAIAPQSATNCNMYTMTLINNNFRSALPGGLNFDYATGTPTMAAVDTQVPYLDLLISRVPDTGAGAGGPPSGGGGHIISG